MPSETWKLLNDVRKFIEAEYADPAVAPDGEWLAKEARHIHNKVCTALANGPEPLSRTGAVKVKALEWSKAIHGGYVALGAAGVYHVHLGTKEGVVFWFFTNPFDHEPNEYTTSGEAKAAAQADYERRILYALEPAAPECRQDASAKLAKAVWGIDLVPSTRPAEQAVTEAEPAAAYTIDYLGCEHVSRDVESIEQIAANGAQGPTDVVYLYERPAAVTEAMVEAAQAKLRKLGWTYNSDHVRAALKAAMEAGHG